MHRPALFLLLALLFSQGAQAASFVSGDSVVTKSTDKDLFAAGGSVAVDGAVAGDVFIAGADVELNSPVAEDAIIAGVNVTIAAPIAGDLTATAVNLALSSDISGDAALFAIKMEMAPSAAVSGDLSVSGGEIRIDGTVSGSLRVAAAKVILAGTINGDVDVASGELELLPGAHILGNINHSGPTGADIPEGATLGGEQKTSVKITFGDDVAVSEEEEAPTFVGTVLGAGALFLLGLCVLYAFPSLVATTTVDIRSRPVRSFVIGLGTLICLPVIMILLVVTIVGIPVSVLLLLLYAAAFPVGLAVAGFALAELARRPQQGPLSFRPRERLLRYGALMLIVSVVGLVPVIGDILLMLLIVTGIGAIMAYLIGSQRQTA